MKTTKLACLAALLLGCLAPNLSAQNWARLETGAPAGLGANFLDVVDRNTVWTAFEADFGTPADDLFVSRTTDGGATWKTSLVTTDDGEWCIGISAPTALFCCVVTWNVNNGGGKIFTTRDGGLTWKRKGANAFSDPASFPDVVHFWDDQNGFALGDPLGGEYEIYRTADGGETWAAVPAANIPDADQGNEFGTVNSFGTVGSSTAFCSFYPNGMLRSTDRGIHWSKISLPDQNNAYNPSGIAFSDSQNGLAIYTYNNGQDHPTPGDNPKPLRTTDGGLTWHIVQNSDIDQFDETGRLSFVPGTDGTFVAGDFDGWAYTQDYGVTWKYFESETMRLPQIECLDWQTCYGSGTAIGYASPDVARFIGNVLAPKGLNTPYFSVKTWPNPTDGPLNVGLYAPYAYDITCYLHNFTSGKVVATGTIPAGSTSVLMDCSAGDPGVYSLRMVTGKRVQTTMVFLKMY